MVTLFGDDDPRSHRAPRVTTDRGTDVWLTPPDLLAALGEFDLDPCAVSEPRPWPTAKHHLTIADDGLRHRWHGRVFVNPPYTDPGRWLARLAEHDHGMALVFARTETAWFHDHVWAKADACLFLRGRINFHTPDGTRYPHNAGAPNVLAAYGQADADILAAQPWSGAYVPLTPTAPSRHVPLTP